jgi:hypothetical protein
MKNLIIIGLIAAAGYYFYTKGSTCTTEDDVMEKTFEMMREFKNSSAMTSEKKAMQLMAKLENIGSNSSPQETCDAMDELMAEL